VSAQKAAAEARRRSAAGYSGSTVVVAAAMAAVVVFLAAGVVALVVRHLQRRRRSKQPALVDIRQVHARADLPINAAALLLCEVFRRFKSFLKKLERFCHENVNRNVTRDSILMIFCIVCYLIYS